MCGSQSDVEMEPTALEYTQYYSEEHLSTSEWIQWRKEIKPFYRKYIVRLFLLSELIERKFGAKVTFEQHWGREPWFVSSYTCEHESAAIKQLVDSYIEACLPKIGISTHHRGTETYSLDGFKVGDITAQERTAVRIALDEHVG